MLPVIGGGTKLACNVSVRMDDNADLARTAALLIKQHGEEAWTEAALKYFEMKERGDEEGMRVWRLIAGVINEMKHSKPSQHLH